MQHLVRGMLLLLWSRYKGFELVQTKRQQWTTTRIGPEKDTPTINQANKQEKMMIGAVVRKPADGAPSR